MPSPPDRIASSQHDRRSRWLHEFLDRALQTCDLAHAEALDQGQVEPTILLLDLRDGPARSIASAELGPEMVADTLIRGQQLGKLPRVILSLPRRQVAGLLGPIYPELARDLAQSGVGLGYLAVVISVRTGMVAGVRPRR